MTGFGINLHSKLVIKKIKVRKIFILFITTLFLTNCEDPITQVKENIFSAQDNALVENEFNSTIEAMTDWVATSKFYKKANQIIPVGAIVFLKDSTFSDFTGIEGTIDFGPKGFTKPYGLLCSDGKYRAGKIHFLLNRPVEFPGSIFQMTMESTDKFYSGTGEEMNLLSGNLSVENQDGLSLLIKAVKLKLEDEDENTIEWNCIRTIRMVKDAGKGIWRDVYSLEGTANGINRNGEEFEVTIDQPLIKKMEDGCSRTFVKGILSIKNTAANKNIRVDYDPNKDEACDNIAEADINGKKTIFRIK
jgi:hypothetical protein